MRECLELSVFGKFIVNCMYNKCIDVLSPPYEIFTNILLEINIFLTFKHSCYVTLIDRLIEILEYYDCFSHTGCHYNVYFYLGDEQMHKEDHLYITNLLEKTVALRNEVYQEGSELFERWKPHIERKSFVESAMNLAYYISLRSHDIRDIQEDLVSLGLSSLGRLESKTIWNIDTVISILRG